MNFKGNIYEKHSFICQCEKKHALNIGEVVIEPGARFQLPNLIEKLNLGKQGLLVTDTMIYDLMGEEILSQWQSNGLIMETCILKGTVHPDEASVGKVFCSTTTDINFVVALGGGTITDTVRYVTSRLGIPCVVIPTAMTMDGFFTNMSLIVINGLKKTFYGDDPTIILGDMDLISKAPSMMNAAGVGEVASKISAGLDWYAASLIKGDHYCSEIEEMMTQCIEEGLDIKTIEGIPKGDLEALKYLTDALYKSAVAMSWYGSARCGAGAEHHITHYWVMCHEARGVLPHMHGHEVGVGAVINLMLWDEMLKIDYKGFKIEDALDKAKTRDEWKRTVLKIYGKSAQNVFKEQKDKSFDKNELRKEIHTILNAMNDIKNKFITLPSAEALAEKLNKAGAPYSPGQLNVEKEELIESLYYAKEIRNKYTSLWIVDALGLLDEVVPIIVKRVEKLSFETNRIFN